MAKSAKIKRRESAGAMQRVGGTGIAGSQIRKRAQRIGNGAVVLWAVSRWKECYRSKTGRKNDQASSVLRNAVIRTVNDVKAYVSCEAEFFVVQDLEKLVEHRVALKLGNVLHRDDVGLCFTHESPEFPEKGPFGVLFVVDPLRVL